MYCDLFLEVTIERTQWYVTIAPRFIVNIVDTAHGAAFAKIVAAYFVTGLGNSCAIRIGASNAPL